jgi:hypothetical protein
MWDSVQGAIHRQPALPEGLQQPRRLSDRGFRADQLHRSAGEVVVLQVDEN